MFEALKAAVLELESKGRITRLAGIKPEISRRMPDFDERRVGFPTFGSFVAAAVQQGIVQSAKDADGWERISVANSNGASVEPSRLRPDIWKAFTQFGEGWLRGWDRATARAVRLSASPRPSEPPEHAALRAELTAKSGAVVPIIPIPMQDQLAWMKEFASEISGEPLALPLAAALEDARPFRSFTAVLQADQLLRRRFTQMRFERVLAAVRHWAAENAVDLDAVDHNAEPPSARSVEAKVAASRVPEVVVRQALHLAVDRMPVEDLLRIAIPIGYVLDALR